MSMNSVHAPRNGNSKLLFFGLETLPFAAHSKLLLGYLLAENDLVYEMLAVIMDKVVAALTDTCSRYGDRLFWRGALQLFFQTELRRFYKLAA